MPLFYISDLINLIKRLVLNLNYNNRVYISFANYIGHLFEIGDTMHNLQTLRISAGFKSAKDFAEHLGIPQPTYARYENNPEKIPLKSAWQLADYFEVSIDEIVGREHGKSGAIQATYNTFLPKCRKMADDYFEYLSVKNKQEAQKQQEKENRRYEVVCKRYEEQFFNKLLEQPEKNSNLLLGNDESIRSEFEKYLTGFFSAIKPSGYEEIVAKLMDAYDRTHDSFTEAGLSVFASDE